MRTNKNRLNPTYQSSDIHMDTTHQSSFSEKSGVLPCWSCHYFDYLWNYFFGIAFKNLKKKCSYFVFKRNFLFPHFLFLSFFPILSLLNLALVLPSPTLDSAHSLKALQRAPLLVVALNWKLLGKVIELQIWSPGRALL